MRYASALMLASLAVSEVAAANNARHASFHARRSAESKRKAGEVDWENVAYDLSGVDFNTVDYGNGAKTSAAAVAPAPAVSSKAAAPVSSQAKATSTAPASTQQEKASAAKSSAAAPAKTESSSVGEIVGDITAGLDSFSFLGVMAGATNSKTKTDGGIWLGDGGDYKATFTNDGDSTIALLCWRTATMWINVAAPTIFITIGAGKKQTLSIGEGYSGGCGAADSDSVLTDGQLNESIFEFTAKKGGGNGCFDVSREINMKGLGMSAKGSMCTSGLDGDKMSCTFVCTNGADKCGLAGEYAINVGTAEMGPCMAQDPMNGGCQMSGPGEHMQVTIYGHRTWPANSI